jgi:hypothetical protein
VRTTLLRIAIVIILAQGDLCFGSPFGMLSSAADAAPVVEDQATGIEQYGQKSSQVEAQAVKYFIPAVRVLHKVR